MGFLINRCDGCKKVLEGDDIGHSHCVRCEMAKRRENSVRLDKQIGERVGWERIEKQEERAKRGDK